MGLLREKFKRRKKVFGLKTVQEAACGGQQITSGLKVSFHNTPFFIEPFFNTL